MNIMSGKTLFVDSTTPACVARDGFSECFGVNVGGPLLTVAQGITRASAGDIVLIRPGHYNEPMTITKALTFRATRGNALVGTP
jgi:nitrous oxidase accessory protein NosD